MKHQDYFEAYIEESGRTAPPLDDLLPGLGLARLVPGGGAYTKHMRLMHAQIGLSSELDELQACLMERPANMTLFYEEMGDICWYVAEALRAFPADRRIARACCKDALDFMPALQNRDHGTTVNTPGGMLLRDGLMRGLTGEIGRLCGDIKALVFYGRAVASIVPGSGDKLAIDDVIIERCHSILTIVITILTYVGAVVRSGEDFDVFEEFNTLLAANIEKLKRRYPEKFTAEAANKRDLDKERLALEGALNASLSSSSGSAA